MTTRTLKPEVPHKMDAYWRAAKTCLKFATGPGILHHDDA